MKTLTLAALVSLGGTALADDDRDVIPVAEASGAVLDHGSHRNVSKNTLVSPSGGELSAQMKFVMAEPSLGGEEMKFSDLALFGIGGRWSLLSKLELSLEVNFLAKQPSFTDERPWQNIGGAVRSPLGKRAAVQLSAAGGHLIDHVGMWTKEALMIQWRKPIADVLHFDLAGGVDGVVLSAPDGPSAFIAEAAVATSALFRAPNGVWGGWVGLAYAMPVAHRGKDPTTEMTVDPQPRLDLRVGTVLSLVDEWDLFAEFAVVDRGDMQDARTRLPILDGGFDQRQVILGVTTHFGARERREAD